jgi:hypothetical protein
MKKVERKLFGEMKKESVIISNTFKFPGRKESKKVDNFYIYTVE